MLSGAMIFAFQAPAAVAMADLFAKEPGRFPLPRAKEFGKNFIINQWIVIIDDQLLSNIDYVHYYLNKKINH